MSAERQDLAVLEAEVSEVLEGNTRTKRSGVVREIDQHRLHYDGQKMRRPVDRPSETRWDRLRALAASSDPRAPRAAQLLERHERVVARAVEEQTPTVARLAGSWYRKRRARRRPTPDWDDVFNQAWVEALAILKVRDTSSVRDLAKYLSPHVLRSLDEWAALECHPYSGSSDHERRDLARLDPPRRGILLDEHCTTEVPVPGVGQVRRAPGS